MKRAKPSIPEDWYQLTFDELYPLVYAHRTVESAEPEARFSIERTAMSPNDRVLDLCCGNGRHLAHLMQVAGRVYGLDYSLSLLRQARETVGEGVSLLRADMRFLPFRNAFDVVVNYFTSFGYFLVEEDNAAVVEGVAASLRSGGRFFIDYLNRAWMEDTLQPESVRWYLGYEICEQRWIDDEHRRINKNTIIRKDGINVNQAGESVRLYTPEEFCSLLERGGLVVESLYGNYEGDACGPALPRMIAVGRKA